MWTLSPQIYLLYQRKPYLMFYKKESFWLNKNSSVKGSFRKCLYETWLSFTRRGLISFVLAEDTMFMTYSDEIFLVTMKLLKVCGWHTTTIILQNYSLETLSTHFLYTVHCFNNEETHSSKNQTLVGRKDSTTGRVVSLSPAELYGPLTPPPPE